MSKKRYKEIEYNKVYPMNNCCDFPTLIILILIILQFNDQSKYNQKCDCDCDCECEEESKKTSTVIDNSLLFIIALFFLSCCNPCRQPYIYL